MKTLRLLGVLTVLLGLSNWANAQCTADAPLIVGPADQFAFQWCNGTSTTSIGLQFASSVNEYQFKKVSGTNLMTLNPTVAGGYVRMGDPDAGNYTFVDVDGDLRFSGTADLLVANNAYAFRSAGDEDNGLFFNVAANQYEFRSNSAAAGLSIKANTAGLDEDGDLAGAGSAIFEDELTAGNSSLFGVAAVKGISANGPTNGYLGVPGVTDFDGIVGLNLFGFEVAVLGVSTGGSTTDNYGLYGYSNGIGAYAENTNSGYTATLASQDYALDLNGPVNLGGGQMLIDAFTTPVNTSNGQGPLYVRNGNLFGGTYGLGFDGNEIQSYVNDTAVGSTLYLNYWDGNVQVQSLSSGTFNIGNGNLHVNNSTDRVGIGNTSPNAKLDVDQDEIARALNIIYSAPSSNSQIVNIESTTALSSGNDLLQLIAATGSSTSSALIEGQLGSAINFQVNANGNTGIGTTASSIYALQVCGTIRAEEILVETGWCDYVFEDDYKLASLSEVESFINENKHLPGIPSAAVVESQGVAVADMTARHMLKIEELTLYTIEQEKQINALQAQLEKLSELTQTLVEAQK